ncbi:MULTISPECIES: DUF1380 family protein [Enterobacteriaceae]|uniref:DUF1380 domain-containing protein n=1 Tax=Citrobacter telavivensis TaxID=2653932 RepID=A0A6L5EFD9_9ENTR|nr:MULTISPECIES: DUF1380 family protein [Enterobacteriaceae]HDR2614649.1 DUF1380 family protein [Enterobacter ludwigii]KLV71344.1 hypothetical protein SK37_04967 [Citrobacter sp. MGH109]MDT7093065.1 DUF1380 family protein [Citrobacter freundii]MPQ54217.1 DUF1380 domain-containing protein [Citrobacter telavivensis]QFS69042.1 DUF1380 domain-containing protein [Citrobacter telavivensis]
MYGTVSDICCNLLKVFENKEKIAVIIWNEEDVREVGAAFNPTVPDTQAVLRAIGDADSDALWRDGIGRNFVEGELRWLAALRPPRQIAIPEDALRTLLPLMEAGMNIPRYQTQDRIAEEEAALDTLRYLLSTDTSAHNLTGGNQP